MWYGEKSVRKSQSDKGRSQFFWINQKQERKNSGSNNICLPSVTPKCIWLTQNIAVIDLGVNNVV
jgi:hypothetical protein